MRAAAGGAWVQGFLPGDFRAPDSRAFSLGQSDNLLYLHDALEKLAAFDERKAKALEMRFFGGLTSAEIAEALDISVPTVTREMRLATAWLRKEMGL